jgi:hypothetical protein
MKQLLILVASLALFACGGESADKADEAMDAAGDAAGAAMESVGEAAGDADDAVGEMADDAMDAAGEVADDAMDAAAVGDMLEEKPQEVDAAIDDASGD